MSTAIETVKVKHDNAKGYHIINKANFNPETHELYDAEKAKAEGATRDEMKAFLSEKGVEFPANIKTDKLAELYDAEKAKAE